VGPSLLGARTRGGPGCACISCTFCVMSFRFSAQVFEDRRSDLVPDAGLDDIVVQDIVPCSR
jgi:hypothetical protein